jgi:hypothetical protein
MIPSSIYATTNVYEAEFLELIPFNISFILPPPSVLRLSQVQAQSKSSSKSNSVCQQENLNNNP